MRLRAKMSLICMRIKITVISKASRLPSFKAEDWKNLKSHSFYTVAH